jgi:membrane-associated protease RseP (regulator of RpoE activity)
MKERELAKEIRTAIAMVLLWIALVGVLLGVVMELTHWL